MHRLNHGRPERGKRAGTRGKGATAIFAAPVRACRQERGSGGGNAANSAYRHG
jgi:hypothetical protein